VLVIQAWELEGGGYEEWGAKVGAHGASVVGHAQPVGDGLDRAGSVDRLPVSKLDSAQYAGVAIGVTVRRWRGRRGSWRLRR
jgi:hypothetical protein